MRNKSTEATEKKLRAIEKEVRKIYKEAYKGITEKWSKYMRTVEASAADRKEAWELAKKENGENSPEAQEAKKAYTEYLKQATVVNSRFKTMQQETAQKITQRNQIAAQYVNGEMASVYISNYNETAKVRHAVTGYNFTEVNEATVAKLITNKKDSLLPQSEIDIPKDMAWNKQKMTGQVLQGILQGEGIPQISKRLQNVVGMNAASAVRNARTMITAAQNRGRLDQMKQQQKMGIRVQKEWLATKDRRTRDSHAELDGERVDLNKPFSNGLMQPGDPAGEPAEVYNCRCTLVYYYPDFDMDAEEADNMLEDEEEKNSLDFEGNSGIIVSGRRTISQEDLEEMNEEQKRRTLHAARYYDEIEGRNTESVVNSIRKNSGFDVEEIRKVYNYIIVDTHDFLDTPDKRFYPSYWMAQSFQHLIEGKNILPMDILCINHELLEIELISKGMTQDEAHLEATKAFNYTARCREMEKKEKGKNG